MSVVRRFGIVAVLGAALGLAACDEAVEESAAVPEEPAVVQERETVIEREGVVGEREGVIGEREGVIGGERPQAD